MHACLFLLRIADDTGIFGNTGEESEAHIMRRTLAFFRGESLLKQASSLKLRMSLEGSSSHLILVVKSLFTLWISGMQAQKKQRF